MLSSSRLLIINGAILSVCAVLTAAWQEYLLLTVCLLFLPILDKGFRHEVSQSISISRLSGYAFVCLVAFAAISDSFDWHTVAAMFVFTALPEEWFFRRYMQTRLSILATDYAFFSKLRLPYDWSANISTSLFFALLHLPHQGIVGLSVFIPSLVLGYVYQRTQDFVFAAFIHLAFNVIYQLYLRQFV